MSCVLMCFSYRCANDPELASLLVGGISAEQRPRLEDRVFDLVIETAAGSN